MSTSSMGANKPIEDIEATLLAATKSALDELVWWAHATMAAKAAEAARLGKRSAVYERHWPISKCILNSLLPTRMALRL
jgi:hypothetical protein